MKREEYIWSLMFVHFSAANRVSGDTPEDATKNAQKTIDQMKKFTNDIYPPRRKKT